MDLGFGLVRVVVGLLVAGHGVQKLSTWLGGVGPDKHAEFLGKLGYRPARPMAVLHGVAELAAGLLLAVGLATPLAAALILAVMINAMVAVHAPNGVWSQNGGVEYPLLLAVLAAAFAIGGPGAYALDPLVGVTADPTWSIGALIAGLLIGGAVLGSRRWRPARRHAAA